MIHKNTPIWNFKLWVVMLKDMPSHGKIERVDKAPNARIILDALDKDSDNDFCFRVDAVDWNTGVSINPEHPLIEAIIRKYFEKNFNIKSYKVKEL